MPTLVNAQGASLSPSLKQNPLLSAWLRIQADGFVSVYPGKVELGQGIGTALAQIVADELDVDFNRIRIEPVDTDYSPDESYTFSSISIQHSGGALRQAGAEMRHLFIRNVTHTLDVDPAQVTVSDGELFVDDAKAGMSYWTLLADTDFNIAVDGNVAPKSPQQYRFVGQSPTRLDLPEKVFAGPAFIQDVRLPGMVHARVIRPPHQGQPLIDVNADAVTTMPGLFKIVRDGNFLAVVATREEQAINIAEILRAVTRWGDPAARVRESDLPLVLRKLETEDTIVHQTKEPVDESVRALSADYSRPFTAHGSISPSAALALWEDGRLTVWSHGQGMFPLRGALATTHGLSENQVRLIYRPAAGCYGHNGADDAACDASIIAMRMPGKAVRLQWSRQDEFRYEPFGSAMSVRVSAGLDNSNRITHWNHDVWSGTHSMRSYGAAGAGNLLAAREKTDPLEPPPPRNIPQPAGGGDRNALPLYSFANQAIAKHLVQKPPLGVSALRGLGAFANVFAIESFIDELAGQVDEDSLSFRLRYLKDNRGRAVLESIRDILAGKPELRTGWKSARGLGFARFKNLGAYVAVVCEVHVNDQTGQVKVSDAFAAVDAGLVISPDGLRNQIEGGIVQSTSWTLKEAVHYDDDSIQTVDWATYPMLRFTEVPRLAVTLLDRPDQPSLGAGEAAQGPTAAAIANGIAAATGVRLRDLPLTPDRVLRELRLQAPA